MAILTITCPHVDPEKERKEGEEQTHLTLAQAACHGALIKLTQECQLVVCDVCWQVMRARMFDDVINDVAKTTAEINRKWK
jgi:hypothetical protein